MGWDSPDNQPTTEEWLGQLDRDLERFLRTPMTEHTSSITKKKYRINEAGQLQMRDPIARVWFEPKEVPTADLRLLFVIMGLDAIDSRKTTS